MGALPAIVMRLARSPGADALLAAALTVAGVLEALLTPDPSGSRLASALAVPVATVPLAWRRTRTVLALYAIAAAMLASSLLDGMLVGEMVAPLVALAIALYSAGRYAGGPVPVAAALAAVPVFVATRAAFDPSVQQATDVAGTAAAVLVPLAVGRWVRGQLALQGALADTAARLIAQRERDARQAAEDERVRIVGDLQVAVADSLRAVQAQARELPALLRAGDHAQARRAFHAMGDRAREALGDVRRVLGILRRDDRPPRRDPPGRSAEHDLATAVALADRDEELSPAAPRARVPWRVPAAWVDVAIVAVLLAGTQVQLALAASAVDRLAAMLTCALVVVPLLARRRWPVPVAAAVVCATALQSLLTDLDSLPAGEIGAIICAAYAVGAHAERRAAVAGLVLAAAGAGVHAAVFYPDNTLPALLGGVAVPWTVGRIVRGQRRLTREGRDRAAAARVARAQEERAAVTAERMRVARELHDVVAHNISVIAIQAGGAGPIAERDPQRAAQCAALIEEVAGEALAELGRLLGDAQAAPQPSLARVDGLATRARESGLPVAVRIEGRPAALPAGVDLAAYRIVQEALANTSKHARARHAWVVVRYDERAVEVEVGDDGRGAAAPQRADGAAGGGHGLIGMRERVALYGGTLDVARPPEGGFTVRARLPIGAA